MHASRGVPRANDGDRRAVGADEAASLAGVNLRRLWQIVRGVLPVVAFGVILAVLHQAGVPLSVPGVLCVLVALVVVRLIVASRVRRRRHRAAAAERQVAVTPRRRAR